MVEMVLLDKEEEGNCHGEVETGSDFSDVAGGEVEDEFSFWEVDVAVSEGASDSFFGFSDGGVGQTDDFDAREGFGGVGFDVDFVADESEVGEGFDNLYHSLCGRHK